MLTVEEIKQAVPFADGFKIGKPGKNTEYAFYSEDILVKGSFDIDNPLDNLLVYDLFLDRVIQGMNRKYYNEKQYIAIITNPEDIEVGVPNYVNVFKHDGTAEGIREAREKAIRFVLKEGV